MDTANGITMLGWRRVWRTAWAGRGGPGPHPLQRHRPEPLRPHHWSCGFASFGIENREAAIRICPSAATDPADLSEAERLALGIVPLPASLTEALAALEADAIARSWMPLLNDTTY